MSSSLDSLSQHSPLERWMVTVFGLFAAFSVVLSATIANVAVPHVMGAFGVGQDQAQWMATAFITAMTVSQLLNHWMVESFGERGAFILTIIVFLIGTAIGWSAPNIELLVLGRVLQGFSAGILQPLVMLTMFKVFPPDRRGLAMGIYGAGVVLAPGLGPAVGGMAIDAFDWRFIFIMPIPFCLIGLVGGAFFMPTRSGRGRPPPFDWIGYLLLAAALGLLMTAVADGIRKGWSSNEIVLMFTGGTGAAIAFVLWQLKSPAPLLDFSLWRNNRFASSLLVAFVFGAGNFGSSYIIPVFVQTVQGYTATQAGLVLMPAGLLLVLALPITGRISDRLPSHIPIIAGLVLFAVGIGSLSTSDVNTPFWTFAALTCISRFGMAFMLPALNVGALSTLRPEELARGSGNLNFIRQLGGAAGTNLIVVWLQLRTAFHGDALAATQTSDNQTSREFLSGLARPLSETAIPPELHHTLALDFLSRVLEAQALTLGFKDSYVALAVVFVLALIPTWFFARTR